MDDLKAVYKELTSVDIDEQKELWNKRGKGYYGEYLLLTKLYPSIDGQSKILMNIKLPASMGKTTEIDLLMIHESGLYVFEVKNFKGTIYGKYSDEIWTQYFRTQKNNCFHNPVKQNEYHVAALKSMFPNLPVYSFIIFTDINTKLRVTGLENKKTIICRIDELAIYIKEINNTSKTVLSAEQIDNLFNELTQYSPICDEIETPDGETVQLVDYINTIKNDFSDELQKIQKSERKKYKQKNRIVISSAMVICAIVIGLAIILISYFQLKVSEARKAQDMAEKKFAVFEQKFKQVAPLNGGDVTLEDNFFEVVDYSFKESKDLKDTIIYSCKIQVNGENYGLRIHQNSSIIVQLKDGSVFEYVFGKSGVTFVNTIVASFAPNWYKNTAELPQIYIYTSSVDNIAYIKLTNVVVNTQNNMQSNAFPGIEFELYSAK